MAICNFNYRSDRIYLPGYSGTDLRAVKRNDTVCSRRYMRDVRVYCLVEALITTVLAKQYNPDFRYQWGIENMFFCSFIVLRHLEAAPVLQRSFI